MQTLTTKTQAVILALATIGGTEAVSAADRSALAPSNFGPSTYDYQSGRWRTNSDPNQSQIAGIINNRRLPNYTRYEYPLFTEESLSSGDKKKLTNLRADLGKAVTELFTAALRMNITNGNAAAFIAQVFGPPIQNNAPKISLKAIDRKIEEVKKGNEPLEQEKIKYLKAFRALYVWEVKKHLIAPVDHPY